MPGLVALNPCAGLWGWLAAASLASARSPGALTCSACRGPNANPPSAGEREAGTQTEVTTAPKAASPSSSRSREHLTSLPSSPPTPAASAAGAPHFRFVHRHDNHLGLFVHWVTARTSLSINHLVLLQSDLPRVASLSCCWSLHFSGYKGGSTTPSTRSPPLGLGVGFFCSLSSSH